MGPSGARSLITPAINILLLVPTALSLYVWQQHPRRLGAVYRATIVPSDARPLGRHL